MLDFLGLEKEAGTLMLCLTAVGVFIGIMAAYYHIHGENETKGGKVLSVICIAGIAVAALMGAWPGIVLFFTFQWNIWIYGILSGAAAGGLIWGVTAIVRYLSRRGKYARNPLMKTITSFCRSNGIQAVICYPDRVRFYTGLECPEFCKAGYESEKCDSASGFESRKLDYKIPETWSKTIQSHCKAELVFTEQGYDRVPDLALFSSVLRSKMGWKRVRHYAELTWFQEGKWVGNTKTNTNHICVMYEDYLLFSKACAEAARNAAKQAGRAKADAQREAEKNRKDRVKSGKSWE